MFFFGNFARTIAYRSVKRFSFYRPFYFLFIGQITVRLGLPFFGRDFPLKNIPPKCFSSATSPAPRRNKFRSFRFFYFIKNQSPASLFLLIRKGSRSRRLLICERIRNAFGSLPTLCENAFGIVTVDFTVFFIKPLKSTHKKTAIFGRKSSFLFVFFSVLSLFLSLLSNRRFQRIVKSEE